MSIKAEQWEQLRELFRVAISLPPGARATYLEKACAADPALREEINSLLASHDDAETFIEAPVFAGGLTAFADSIPADQIAGRRIGSYDLIRELGRGGMGTVYLAERADKQYKKQVAIKIVRRGMDTDDILRRFLNERQILASLDHPNISRLLDGGTTDDGLPFLVMEYVEGETLTNYCDQHALATNERLRIFRTICAAVQHAHQNLVIHRDLKPSNILITSEGVPKLLDFGIAKVFNIDSEPSTELTLTELRVLTPYYASPEQLRGETLTTASDVYSLGILLYELLTGVHPYRSRNMPPHELARIICEDEPAKPSDTIADVAVRDSDSKADSKPHRKPKLLRGDLDNIILMALRKDPVRRYPSVGEFSADLGRYLEGLPVVARKDTFKYRATKFMRRNRLSVAAAAIILLSLVGGMVATAWQARVARREKANAENVNSFLKKLLGYSNPMVQVSGGNGNGTSMKDVLDEASRRLDGEEFSGQPEVKAELEHIIADSYFGQGNQDLWEQHLKKFIALQTSLYGENAPQTVEATALSAMLAFHDQKFADAESIFRRVLPMMRTGRQKGSITAQELAEALNNFGYLRRTQGDSKEAESLFRETLSLKSQLPGDSYYLIGLTRCTLASTLADQGKFPEALQAAQEAVDEYRKTGRTETPDFGFVLTILGGFLTEKASFAEADNILKEAEVILRQRQSPYSLWLGDNLRNQAVSYYQQGRYVESQSKIAEAESIYLKSFGPTYDQYPTVLIFKGLILDKTGKSKEGEVILREAVKLRTQTLAPDHFWVNAANSALGECLTTQKRFAEAQPLLLDSYNGLKKSQGVENPRTLLAQRRLFELYQSWHKPEIADKYRS